VNLREETPWNYCDYRCELCNYQETCDVFHAVETERQVLTIQGKDPDDLETVAQSVAATLTETLENLKEEARRRGIDVDAVARESTPGRERPFRSDPLYRKARDLTLRIAKFIQARHPDSGAGQEKAATAWDNLTWHHTLFSAKIARALSGLEHAEDWAPEYGVPDYRISAGIALKSIFECRSAFETLKGGLPGAENAIAGLRASLEEVHDLLRAKFDRQM
jgi:hypothetical protein